MTMTYLERYKVNTKFSLFKTQVLGLHKSRLTCIFVLRVTFREGGTLGWGFAFLRVPLIEKVVPKC